MTKFSRPLPDQLVAGEPLPALVEAIVQCMPTQIDDGWYRVDVELDPSTGAPLARALMRVEAEMLLYDADNITNGSGDPVREPNQRRADAFVELTHRVYRAMSGLSLPLPQSPPLAR